MDKGPIPIPRSNPILRWVLLMACWWAMVAVVLWRMA